MGERGIPPEVDGALSRAAAIEPMFAVPAAVLDRIASATAPAGRPGVVGTLREIVMTLVDASSGGLKPAFRAGANPSHGVRKLTYTAGGLRLTLMLEPTAPGLPAGLPSDYRVLGRLTRPAGESDKDACGTVEAMAVAPGPRASQSGVLDEHGFFELTLAQGVHRLEFAFASTRVVVPQLEVGSVEGP